MPENQTENSFERKMPEDSITKDFQELFDAKDADIVSKLAVKYNVSETALTLRLIDLNLV
ncbi:MAG TPA: hypothetical protein ENH40_02400 [Nitrospirae bacterium]|nr:hypothetical protein [Nitrospirota bacterium]